MPAGTPNGEKRILYWLLGALLSLLLFGLGWHTKMTADAMASLSDRLDALTRAVYERPTGVH